MTHCVWVMLAAVLLQPPVPPVKPQPAPAPKPSDASAVWPEMSYLIDLRPATHPEIRIAEARLMQAQAALDQAKRKVAIESALNKAKYDQAKADAAAKTKEFERLDAIHKSGEGNNGQHAQAAAELQAAKRQLAFAELFKQAAKEDEQAPKSVLSYYTPDARTAMRRVDATLTTPLAQSQSLYDLLQCKVKFAVKATDKDQTVIGVLERSMKEWDFAAAKVIVRYPNDTNPNVRSLSTVQAVEGENTVGVWLLMLLDDFNAQQDKLPETTRGKHQIYVREYGLLFTLVKNAPDGAPTLAEFLRQAKK